MKRLLDERGSMNFSESLALKAVSLLLALILWITILGFKKEEIQKNVKLEPLLPPGMMMTNKIPPHITFTLSGPRVLLKDLEKKIQPIRWDLRSTRETTRAFNVSAELLGELPVGVRVTSYVPTGVIIKLEEVVERYIAVKPTLSGSPGSGYEIVKAVASPAKVAVSGPRSAFQTLPYVGTEVFDVQDLTGTKEGIVSVEVDATQGYQLSRDKVVRVIVTTKRVHKQ